MKIHPNAYKHLEVPQVIAIDKAFPEREGTLFIDVIHGERVCSYNPTSPAEPPLSKLEHVKLNRIVYGWGPKVHSAPKAQDEPEEKAEVEPGSFSKIKNSLHKDMMHLVPLNVIREVAAVYTANFKQYGEDWKVLPNAKKEFYNSMMRHLERWQSGETIDPDDGKKHIVKALGNLIFLVWHELQGGVK